MKKKNYLRPAIRIKTLSVLPLLATSNVDNPEKGPGGITDPGKDPSEAKSHSMWNLEN